MAIEAARRPRADSLRNRERLLDVARAAFVEGNDTIAFDEIARRAGVGIGTLYRHFPNRPALIESLYRSQVESLAREARQLSEELPPIEALRAWMLLFVDYMASKRLIAAALEALVGSSAGVFGTCGDLVKDAARELAAPVVEAGLLDPTVDPVDLLRALSGVLSIASGSDAGPRARQLVDVLLAGAKPDTT